MEEKPTSYQELERLCQRKINGAYNLIILSNRVDECRKLIDDYRVYILKKQKKGKTNHNH
jgi:hypothetical protein